MSNIPDSLSLLMGFGKIRRLLNLKATQALKPMGIGPKQAVLLRECLKNKAATPGELAELTQTDPGATGKIIESLIKKGWMKRSDHPVDRRSWQISLTETGIKATQKLDVIFRALAEDFCAPLDRKARASVLGYFTDISTHLENCLEASSKDLK